MAWETSDRRSRLPSNWKTYHVPEVKKRARGQCEWILPKSKKRCPRKGVDVDHRRPGDDHSLSNLQLLCEHHHDKKTQREAWGGRTKKRSGRPEEAHPGYNRH